MQSVMHNFAAYPLSRIGGLIFLGVCGLALRLWSVATLRERYRRRVRAPIPTLRAPNTQSDS